MNVQHLYDVMVSHCMEQGERAVDERGQCVYLDPKSGLRCAVGCLLTEQDALNTTAYSVDANELPVCAFKPEFQWATSHVVAQELLMDAQYCHDNVCPENWPRAFLDLAEQYDLDPGILISYTDGGPL